MSASIILDQPDQSVRAIYSRKMTGGRLTPAEERRLQARLAAEAETLRVGGTVRHFLEPERNKPLERQLTPEQKGVAEEKAALEYLRGRDRIRREAGLPPLLVAHGAAPQAAVSGGTAQPDPKFGSVTNGGTPAADGGTPAADGGTPAADGGSRSYGYGMDGAIAQSVDNMVRGVRRSPISNDAPEAKKIADNARGPHLGADGFPATWNVPKQIAGGQVMQPPANMPSGTTAYRGADGAWKQWKNGAVTNEDVGSGKPIVQPKPTAPAQDAPTAQHENFIRESGYGDFIDRAHGQDAVAALPESTPGPRLSQQQVAQARVPAGPSTPRTNGEVAPAYSVKGVLQRAGTPEEWAMAPANILAAPGRAIDTGARAIGATLTGLWNGNYSMPPSLTETLGNKMGEFLAKPITNQPNTPAQPQDFAPMSELGAYSGAPSPLPSAEDVSASPAPAALPGPSVLDTSLMAPPSPAVRNVFSPIQPAPRQTAANPVRPAPRAPSPIQPAPFANPIRPAPRALDTAKDAPATTPTDEEDDAPRKQAAYQSAGEIYNPFKPANSGYARSVMVA
jgi:hypothetical protein